ncbi:hypothetical protein [Saccharopolyspora pogona]|uniref:hypothetical protein n=1 Tax=Saccharopolyspora pogona TaxID=333966 RepID=UPI001681CD98|nr:hypothetical protein [Saccharopolyspora pogona]
MRRAACLVLSLTSAVALVLADAVPAPDRHIELPLLPTKPAAPVPAPEPPVVIR